LRYTWLAIESRPKNGIKTELPIEIWKLAISFTLGGRLKPDALTTTKNKLIINQDVLLRTPIIQDAVRCYREIYEEKKKQTVETKLSMFLIKETPASSTQEHDPDMYCAVSLSKR
jgi:hypothetical protein